MSELIPLSSGFGSPSKRTLPRAPPPAPKRARKPTTSSECKQLYPDGHEAKLSPYTLCNFERGPHRKIGKGGSSSIFIVPVNGESIAVKKLDPSFDYKNELNAWSQISAKCGKKQNIRPLLAAWYSNGEVHFASPYCENSLSSFLDNLTSSVEMHLLLRLLLPEIAQALVCVHAQGFVHRDIKPDNIFFCDGSWVLGDFGISAPPSSGTAISQWHLSGESGDPRFMAPEALDAKVGYTFASDIYSLGKVMSFIFDEIPLSEAETLQLSTLIQKMKSKNPQERPSAENLLMHSKFLYDL